MSMDRLADYDETILEPFTTAVTVALQEMAGVEVIGVGPVGAVESGVSAAIRLPADGPGGDRWLVLIVPTRTAQELARRVLARDKPPEPAIVCDCMGELANVIAGQAKATLFGTPDHFRLTTPVTCEGPFALPPGRSWGAGVMSEAGPFVLELRRPG
jgi:chemotaxis protein CheX